MAYLLLALMAAMGAVTFYWCRQISEHYNCWTTRFRERHRYINPPPSPEQREINTATISTLLRSAGGIVALMALSGLVRLVGHALSR